MQAGQLTIANTNVGHIDASSLTGKLGSLMARVFGCWHFELSRPFSREGRAVDYPLPKKILNRLGNKSIQVLFRIPCNDITNAFKMYRRSVIAGIQPLLAHHFNLTVELPLKAITRGYRYAVVPNSWVNRAEGKSKFRVKEMGSRYFFIVLYCYLEKLFGREDVRGTAQYRETQLQVWHR